MTDYPGTSTKARLRGIGIVNTHDLLKRFAARGEDVACFYHPPEPRACRGHRAAVYSPSHKTNPQAAWYDQGQKTFSGPRAVSLPAAVAWATERYGIKEWAPCPTDPTAKVPAAVRKRALEALALPAVPATLEASVQRKQRRPW